MATSTLKPLWPSPERGGYTVHPVPLPPSIFMEETIMHSADKIIQNLRAFIRGNVMSLLNVIRGINQFPNPAPRTGMTTKKTIRKAWAVIIA